MLLCAFKLSSLSAAVGSQGVVKGKRSAGRHDARVLLDCPVSPGSSAKARQHGSTSLSSLRLARPSQSNAAPRPRRLACCARPPPPPSRRQPSPPSASTARAALRCEESGSYTLRSSRMVTPWLGAPGLISGSGEGKARQHGSTSASTRPWRGLAQHVSTSACLSELGSLTLTAVQMSSTSARQHVSQNSAPSRSRPFK